MINKLLYKCTARRPARLVQLASGPYLERYYVGRLFGLTFYLHRFVSGDSERQLHNHPWGFGCAFVLCGGYEEEVVTDLCPAAGPYGCLTQRRRIRWYNRIDGNHFHRILSTDQGTWTLMVHGARVQLPGGGPVGWGFLRRLITGGREQTVYTPHESRSKDKWWLLAPTGDMIGREEL